MRPDGVWMRTPATGLVTGLPMFNHLVRDRLKPRGGGQPPPGIYAYNHAPGGPVYVVTVPSRYPQWFATRNRHRRGGLPRRLHHVRWIWHQAVHSDGPTGGWSSVHAQGWCGVTITDPETWADPGAAAGTAPCAVCDCRVRP